LLLLFHFSGLHLICGCTTGAVIHEYYIILLCRLWNNRCRSFFGLVHINIIIKHIRVKFGCKYIHIGGGFCDLLNYNFTLFSPFVPVRSWTPPRTSYYHPTHSVTRHPFTTTTPLSPCQPNILANVVKQIISSKRV